MLLCRGAVSVVSMFSRCNFVKSLHCGKNMANATTRTLSTCGFRRACKMLEDTPVKRKFIQVIQLQISFARPTFNSIRFPWIIEDCRANDRLHGDVLCCSSEMCVIHSSTDKLSTRALSTISKKNQLTSPNGVPEKLSERPQGEANKPEPEEKQSKTDQLKKIFKEYGAVGVSFHIGISLISLGITYVALSSGIDMTAVLCKLGFSESVVQSKMAAGTSTFVLAYAVHKLFAPVRISITIVSVPLMVRFLRKIGFFKPT